jgi:hypothetical protein
MGEKKWINSIYFFTFETIVKVQESIFGMTVYSIFVQFSCLNFENVLSIISFILSIIVCAYIIAIFYYIYHLLNSKDV